MHLSRAQLNLGFRADTDGKADAGCSTCGLVDVCVNSDEFPPLNHVKVKNRSASFPADFCPNRV